MSWLDDVLASLQQGGAPAMPNSALGPSPFPEPPKAYTPAEEAELAAGAREAAGQRLIRANQRRPSGPFGVPDMNSAGVQLALEQAPPGTGVPVAPGTEFQPFSIAPPSLKMAKEMAAPPPPATSQGGAPPAMMPPGSVPGMPAGPGAPSPPPPAATDVSAARRGAPMGPAPEMPGAPEKSFGDRLRELAPHMAGLAAGMTGEGWGLAARVQAQQQALGQTQQQANLTARALLARGAPAEEVAAAVRSPELLKAMISKYFETGKPLVVGGHVVREKPGGGLEVLGDFSKDEKKANPVVKEFTNPDGSVIQKQWNPDKSTWDAIPGFEKPGPKDKDRRLSVSDITKLSDEGGRLAQVQGFQSTFKPEFGGWKSNSIGDLVNQAGRNLPESVVGKNAAASAEWWQGYDRFKNTVRHELFGSALTKTESDAFMRADIGPGMTPDQIRKNLATQRRIVEGAMRRKGKGLIGSTYDKGAIAAAYGVDPGFFDQEDAPAPARGGSVDIGGKKINWSVN
jgi:hypothetical protein